mgnify:CR=1 FL=1
MTTLLLRPTLRRPLLLIASLVGVAAGTAILCALNLANERALRSFEVSAAGLPGAAQRTAPHAQLRSPRGRIPTAELEHCLAFLPRGARCRGVLQDSLHLPAATPSAGAAPPVDEDILLLGVDGDLLTLGAPLFSAALLPRHPTLQLPGGQVLRPAAFIPAAEPLVVVARLVDAGMATPHCGDAQYVVVMRYEVEQVVSGAFAGRTLYAAVACPEMALIGTDGRHTGFRVGELHRLSLRPATRVARYSDAFADKAAPRYDVQRAAVEIRGPRPCGDRPCGPEELCADRRKGHRVDEEGRPLEHRKCEPIPKACLTDRSCACIRRHTAASGCSVGDGRIQIDDYPRR